MTWSCCATSPRRPARRSHPAYDLCPREWEADEVDPIQSVQDLVVTKYEFAFFAEIARAWNQSPRPWQAFPDFLRIVYSNRVQRETDHDREQSAQQDDGGHCAVSNASVGPGREPCGRLRERATALTRTNDVERAAASRSDPESFRPSATLGMLRLRSELLAFTRAFFRSRGFWEVETPILSRDVVVDAYLEPFVTRAQTRRLIAGDPAARMNSFCRRRPSSR